MRKHARCVVGTCVGGKSDFAMHADVHVHAGAYVLCLQNDLMELWSLMHFLMPAVFASHAQVRLERLC